MNLLTQYGGLVVNNKKYVDKMIGRETSLISLSDLGADFFVSPFFVVRKFVLSLHKINCTQHNIQAVLDDSSLVCVIFV